MSDHQCPKQMTYGPCGGVRSDGACEVGAIRCPFIDRPHWSAASPQHGSSMYATGTPPLVVVDVRAPAGWSGDREELWRATAAALRDCTALIGEHVDNLPADDDAGAVSSELVTSTLTGAGVPTIHTITGRDRSLEGARAAIIAHRSAGATAIHCVTGDHPAAMALSREARFGAESMTLVALANELGCVVTVAESPASPGNRISRVAAKQRAGASLCILNHGGDVADLVTFVDRCRSAGVTLPFVAPVPMVADARSAGALARFPGLRLPAGYLDAIISAEDPFNEALERAADLTAQIASSGRFAGINLSGSARDTDPWQRLVSTRRFIDHTTLAWTSTTAHR